MTIDLTLYQGHDDYETEESSFKGKPLRRHVKGMKSIGSQVKLTPLEKLLEYCGYAEPDRRLHAMACYLLEHQAAHLSIDFKIFNQFYDIMKASFVKPKDKPCYLFGEFGEKYAKEFLLALSNAKPSHFGEEFKALKRNMVGYVDGILYQTHEAKRIESEAKAAEKERHKPLDSLLRKTI